MNIFNFIFSAEDQANIDQNSISIEETPYSTSNIVSGEQPLSIILSFTLVDPSVNLSIYPLFPGEITFIPSESSLGITPSPEAVTLDHNAYLSWKTEGKLMIKAGFMEEPYLREKLSNSFPIYPNIMWISGIKLTEEFLFETLAEGTGLEKGAVSTQSGIIEEVEGDWRKFAVGEFLSSNYTPNLKFDINAVSNYNFAMPIAAVDQDGNIRVTIEFAHTRGRALDTIDYQNGLLDFFETNYFNIPSISSAFEAHGLVPAVLVYRQCLSQLTNSGILWERLVTSNNKYFIFRFTRTWQPIENYSLNLPQQILEIKNDDNEVLLQTKIPAHGIVFLPNQTNQVVHLNLSGEMTWLPYDDECWKKRGTKNQIPVNIELDSLGTQVSIPHVILRNKMSTEMVLDRSEQEPGGGNCTYISIRRFTRAFINNRITGGRLLQELYLKKQTQAKFDRLYYILSGSHNVNRELIQSACSLDIADESTFIPVRNDTESTKSAQILGRKDILPYFKAFFPELISGSTTLTKGEAAFNVWSSNLYIANRPANRALYNHENVGYGGPGALVALGLADWHIPIPDLEQRISETEDAFSDRNAKGLMTGLEQGTVLQFWYSKENFIDAKDRTYEGKIYYGHSPVFTGYKSGIIFNRLDGIFILDQKGARLCNLIENDSRITLEWSGDEQYIWIGIKWLE